MAIQPLTKRTLDALKPRTTDTFVWDAELSGFGLKITPTGKKIFIVQYRLSGFGRKSTTKRLTLGEFGPLTPEQARRLARQELGRVAQGQDPAAERATLRQMATVAELGEAYLEEVELHRKASTLYEYRRLWKKRVLPELGSKPVPSITSQDIRRLHRSLHKTPYAANRFVAMLASFFSFAAKEGVIKAHENPAHGIEHYAEQPRERFLTPDEFKRLGQALTKAEEVGLPAAPEYAKSTDDEKKKKHRPKKADVPIPANPYAVAAIRLLALTGCRESEILKLTWEAVDLEHGYLRLKDTKTGASVRPLGQSAAALLESIPEMDGNPYVFPGIKPKHHLGDVQRLWYAVRHAAELPELRLHDLRHSFASVPAASGESMLVIKSLLGHARIATTERYAHLGDDPVKRAADKASKDIAGWLDGSAKAAVPKPSETESAEEKPDVIS